MKPMIHQHNKGILNAVSKTTGHFRHPFQSLRRALLFCILTWLSSGLEAQQASSAGIGAGNVAEHREMSVTKPAIQADTCLLPVYFNYRRRLLQYNGKRIDGLTFLEMCRSLPDSSIREQLKRYDAYTAKKQTLVFSTLGSSFAGIALIGGALGNASPATGANPPLIVNGIVCLLAVPVLAICTTVPHQRRKAVLFRDLPVAYNAYAEAQRRMEGCQ